MDREEKALEQTLDVLISKLKRLQDSDWIPDWPTGG